MKVLLDTNALVFSLIDPGRISRAAARVMHDVRVLSVCSQAVFWELAIKVALGKIPLPDKPAQLWRTFTSENPDRVLMITPDHLDRLSTLPLLHGDPFDRIMIAQALEEGLSVVSSDAQWDAYGVQRIW